METEASRVAHTRFGEFAPDICDFCHRETEPGESLIEIEGPAFVCAGCNDYRLADDYEEWEASQASGIEVRSEYREEDEPVWDDEYADV